MTDLSHRWCERFLSDQKREQDHRSPFQRDRARILHSEAFRCLQAKTQIHAVGEDDFYRTRLTHSLEVAQIGSSLRAKLAEDFPAFQQITAQYDNVKNQQDITALHRYVLPPRSLIESLCFAHDIGHPPFGHGGETALNYMMRNNGGFEGNAQSFRIVTLLEPYTRNVGMNLTRRTLLGIIKYPAFLEETALKTQKQDTYSHHIALHDFKPSKGLYRDDKALFDWVLAPLSNDDRQLFCTVVSNPDLNLPNKTLYKSMDCSIMELADDIAYAVHDLEDAIVGGMVTLQQWKRAEAQLDKCHSKWIREKLPAISDKLFSEYRYERKDIIGALVNYFVTHVRWKILPNFSEPLLRYNAELPEDVRAVLNCLKQFVYEEVICDVKTQRVEYKGQRILIELFEILQSNPLRLLPKNIAERWKLSEPSEQLRVISDYLASMSDRQAFKLYKSL